MDIETENDVYKDSTISNVFDNPEDTVWRWRQAFVWFSKLGPGGKEE